MTLKCLTRTSDAREGRLQFRSVGSRAFPRCDWRASDGSHSVGMA
jgi:hypothetical protein